MSQRIILLLLFARAAAAQESLELKGETRTVKVERVVTTTVYDERTVVTKFPFALYAPRGVVGCTWSFPTGVIAVKKIVERQPMLEVSSAPKGQLTVTAAYTVID